MVDPEFRILDIDETDADLSLTWTTTYEALTDQGEDLDYSEYASWLNRLISFQQTGNEHYDYRFRGVLFDSVVTFDISDHWTINQWSPNIDMRSRFGTFERTIEHSNNEVTITTRFDARKALIPAKDIEDLNKFLTIVKRESGWGVNGSIRR